MDLATGAMGSLLPKLAKVLPTLVNLLSMLGRLLREECELPPGVMEDVEFLEREMRSMDAALRKVAKVPRGQLEEHVKIWADNVRELSYRIEDLVDGFASSVDLEAAAPDILGFFMTRLMNPVCFTFMDGSLRGMADEIKNQVQVLANQRDRFKLHAAGDAANLSLTATSSTTVDPRMLALFKDQRGLVGIAEPREEMIKRLTDAEAGVVDKYELKIISIYGSGGLGKTTLARSVYDVLRPQFDCGFFVPVGRNPNMRKVLRDFFIEVAMDREDLGHVDLHVSKWDEERLIHHINRLLGGMRYFIVIDDIWDIRSWEIISRAVVNNYRGSKIITSTRISEVARMIGDVYKLEPLSADRSEELFYKRLSIGKGKNTCDQSVELPKQILQKCGGVPLAIITAASLLADKPREDWSEVYNSIGFGDGDSIHVENTSKILLYSYYDLPRYLRTCLLHLSMYPAGYVIPKHTLIWKWAGEGFVQEKPGVGLFELGEGYFNELINRNMIQPVQLPHNGVVYACRVHDLVLDMICSLSKEENFVVVLGSNEPHVSEELGGNFWTLSLAMRYVYTYTLAAVVWAGSKLNPTLSSNARWLAFQGVIEQDDPPEGKPMLPVRSFNAIMCDISTMPLLSSFHVLRVLAIERCTFMKDQHYQLDFFGSLLQLRYLGLFGTPVTELSSDIGHLSFLQTLDLRDTRITELPRSVVQLSKLKCLRLNYDFQGVMNWIGSLTSLEELWLDDIFPSFVKELGKLTELRELKIECRCRYMNAKLFNDLMVSLGNLQKLQTIQVTMVRSSPSPAGNNWVVQGDYIIPRHLRRLILLVQFPRLPEWIDPLHLQHLSYLSVKVDAVEAHDMEILGRFQELVTLYLSTDDDALPDILGGGAFPKLRYLFTSARPSRFLQGAMPSLEYLKYFLFFEFQQAYQADFASMGIGNLPCLDKVVVYMACSSAAQNAEAELRRTIKAHPNNPTLEVDWQYS